MEKKFSIIIPVYNVEQYISRCLESILKQTYRNYEVIIVNDGSKDHSYEICCKYRELDERIIVISKENQGVSSARNLGLQHASGDYVIFVDSDDTISPDLCKSLSHELEQAKDHELIIFGYYTIDHNIKEEVAIKQETTFEKDNILDALFTLDKLRLLYVVWNKVFVRSKVNHTFPENMSFAEDSCFVFKYIEQMEKIKILTFKGYHYYTNISGSAIKRYHKNMLENCLQEFNYIKGCDIGDQKALIKHAQIHLGDNFWYFILPSLIRTKELCKAEKRQELKRIMDNEVLKSVLYCNGFERKIQKLMLQLSRLKLYGIMIFLYRRIVSV